MRINPIVAASKAKQLQRMSMLLHAPDERGVLSPEGLLEDIFPGASTFSNMAKSAFAVEEPHGLLDSISKSLKWTFITKPAMSRFSKQLEMEIQKAEFGLQAKKRVAEEQGTVIDQSLNMFGLYDSTKGTVDPTGVTFDACRDFVYTVEPLSAILNKLSTMAGQYSSRALSSSKYVDTPGFRVKMSNKKDRKSANDEKRIEELEQFFEEAGYAPPPDEEKPMGWVPGFEGFLRSFTMDSFTLDWTCVRMWADADDSVKYPIVSFAVVDSALIRRRVAIPEKVNDDNTVTYNQVETVRANTPGPIRLVKVEPGGRILEEYATHEMKAAVRRPNTDEDAHGYGLSEVRQALQAITIWCKGRDYNSMRFDKDALPRGVISILANMNEQQFQAFQQNWGQMVKGLAKRWATPMLKGTPATGSGVTWTPFDQSSRDMEYQQFMFSVSVWVHAIFGMSPDETGFSANSPYRPPLSEASPEVNLKYSQDTCFRPYMKYLQHWINYNILYVIEPSRRYKFEFVGLGDYDETADVEMRSARLNTGLTTPRMEWEELDITMPDPILNHPAADFPAPFMTGFNAINQLAMQQKQMDDQDAQMQQQQQQVNGQQHAVNNNHALAAQLQGEPSGGTDTGSAMPASPMAGGVPVPPDKYNDLHPENEGEDPGAELQKAIIAVMSGKEYLVGPPSFITRRVNTAKPKHFKGF